MEWQLDFYRRPLQDEAGNPLWELVICNTDRSFVFAEFCPQSTANVAWLTHQLQRLIQQHSPPTVIQVFRPATYNLLQTVCTDLAIPLEPTRQTITLKQLLRDRSQSQSIQSSISQTISPSADQSIPQPIPQPLSQPYDPIALDQPPPVPLPENLWGDRWRFAALAAGDLFPAFVDRPMPMRHLPPDHDPLRLQLPSSLPIPGVVIDGGRRSMMLARWLQQTNPFALNYIPGEPDGLILAAGLVDRWVLTTFEDQDVIDAARVFRERQQAAAGLHFLLVQPDDSGMTYTGVWVLRRGDGVME